MPSGEYENVADSADYEFVDPTGQLQGQLDQFGEMAQFGKEGLSGAFTQEPERFDDYQSRDAAVNAFLAQAPGLANLAQGPGSQLSQQLNALAARQASMGMQNAATQFASQGAGRSGAANRAMGEAAANPYAQVQAQLGGRQADLTGQLWEAALGQQGQQSLQRDQIGAQQVMSRNELQNALLRQRAQTMGNIYTGGMAGAGQLAREMGGMMAPQYEYQPSPWESFTGGVGDVASIGASAKIIFMCLHPDTRITTAKGKAKKVKRLKPGTAILDGYGNPCSVVGVVKYKEESRDGFFRVSTSKGKALLCDMHEVIDGRKIRGGLSEGSEVMGVRINDIRKIASPKYSYDVITSGAEDSYQLEGLPTRGMVGRIVNRGRRIA